MHQLVTAWHVRSRIRTSEAWVCRQLLELFLPARPGLISDHVQFILILFRVFRSCSVHSGLPQRILIMLHTQQLVSGRVSLDLRVDRLAKLPADPLQALLARQLELNSGVRSLPLLYSDKMNLSVVTVTSSTAPKSRTGIWDAIRARSGIFTGEILEDLQSAIT
jgi:hypothetical protein